MRGHEQMTVRHGDGRVGHSGLFFGSSLASVRPESSLSGLFSIVTIGSSAFSSTISHTTWPLISRRRVSGSVSIELLITSARCGFVGGVDGDQHPLALGRDRQLHVGDHRDPVAEVRDQVVANVDLRAVLIGADRLQDVFENFVAHDLVDQRLRALEGVLRIQVDGRISWPRRGAPSRAA